jgi:hypothetical protein
VILLPVKGPAGTKGTVESIECVEVGRWVKSEESVGRVYVVHSLTLYRLHVPNKTSTHVHEHAHTILVCFINMRQTPPHTPSHIPTHTIPPFYPPTTQKSIQSATLQPTTHVQLKRAIWSVLVTIIGESEHFTSYVFTCGCDEVCFARWLV